MEAILSCTGEALRRSGGYKQKLRWVLAPVFLLALAACKQPTPRLQLAGYVDAQGAISVQHKGDTVDPYFALQALLLAHENGLDITAYAKSWTNWLVQHQKPDGTFDRFCRKGPVWVSCKSADADDALLALWLKFLDTMPGELADNPTWQHSHRQSHLALSRLLDRDRGIFLVSPFFQHGLFMDNLEVLSYLQHAQASPLPAAERMERDIHRAFWDEKKQRYLVSTQPEQRDVAHSFYPEQVAQIYPLLFDFSRHMPDRERCYRQWMRDHRELWLKQVHDDFAWGLIAVIALQQGDPRSAKRWLKAAVGARHSAHWIVTDEVAFQVLASRGISPR